MSSAVDILGVVLDVELDPDMAAVLHPLGLPAFGVAPDATLRVTRNGVPPEQPDRQPDTVDGELAVWWTEDGIALADPAGVTASVTRDAALIDGRGSPERAAAYVEYVIAGVLTNLLARHRRYVLHAAVIGDARGAVIVTGTTGAGKSTAALAANAAGLDVLGDDMAVVHRRDDGFVTVALPQPLHLPGDLGTLPADAVPFVGDPRDRWVVDVPARPPVPLLGTVLLAHGDGDARLEAAGGPDVIAAVLGAFSSWRDPSLRSEVFALAVELAQLPVRHRLWHDADPARRVERAGSLLRELLT